MDLLMHEHFQPQDPPTDAATRSSTPPQDAAQTPSCERDKQRERQKGVLGGGWVGRKMHCANELDFNGPMGFFQKQGLKIHLMIYDFMNTHADTDAEFHWNTKENKVTTTPDDTDTVPYSKIQGDTDRIQSPGYLLGNKQHWRTADIGIYCLACTKTSLNEVINRIQ